MNWIHWIPAIISIACAVASIITVFINMWLKYVAQRLTAQ